ncbi:MAG: hypothetical protein ACJAZ2_001906, partial [Glaciecola sp.]
MSRPTTIKKSLLITLLCLVSGAVFAQPGTIKGTLRDDSGKGISGVQITISNSTHFTFSDSIGNYSIKTKASKRLFIAFSHLTYNSKGQETSLKKGEVKVLDFTLKPAFEETDTVNIKAKKTVKIKEVEIDADLI